MVAGFDGAIGDAIAPVYGRLEADEVAAHTLPDVDAVLPAWAPAWWRP